MTNTSFPTITRILFLVPTTQLELCEEVSNYLKIELETEDHLYDITVSSDIKRSLKAIKDQSPDIVIASDRPEKSSNISCFPFLSRLNKQCPGTLKILIVEDKTDYPEEINKTISKYLISHVFLKGKLEIEDLAEAVIQLLEVTDHFSNGYALLIGVGGDPSFTINNMQDLHKILINPSIAAYYPNYVDILTEEDASKENILNALGFLAREAKSNPEAIVSIFFSGYGGYLENNQYFFVTYFNGDSEYYENTFISIHELFQEISEIKAKKIILWFDFCYEGGLCPEGRISIRLPHISEFNGPFLTSERYVIVTSSSEGETSRITANGKYSIFTHCLFEALKGRASQQSDDYVYIRDVLEYLREKVTRQAHDPQNPTIIPSIEQIDENFPICRRSKLATVDIPVNHREVPSTRTGLYNYIIDLPNPQFEYLLYCLYGCGLPKRNIPDNTAARINRVGPLMEWVESPMIGCGLARLKQIIEDMLDS